MSHESDARCAVSLTRRVNRRTLGYIEVEGHAVDDSEQSSVPSRRCLPLRAQADVVACRQLLRDIATKLNFSMLGQTMLVTAASELARNTLIHGGGGDFSWEVVSDGIRSGVRVTFADEGPGISDVERAMTDGWTSGKGLGLGLPGAKRLVHEFNLQSSVGKGTQVVITRWK